MTGCDGCRVKAKALESVGTQIGDEHIGASEQLFTAGETIRRLKIKDHTALTAVVLGKGRVGEFFVNPDSGEHTPLRIPVGRLQFDDLGTPVSHDAGSSRSCYPLADLKNSDSVQWPLVSGARA
jgi:hypothetical protein